MSAAEQDVVVDEVDIIQSLNGAVLYASPPVVPPAAGGEDHGAPIWEHEFADRWASLQPLLNRTLDEEEPDVQRQ